MDRPVILMWLGRILLVRVFVASQHFYTWSLDPSVSCDASFAINDCEGWMEEPPQALLQRGRFISQNRTVPVLTDSADFSRDKSHGLANQDVDGKLQQRESPKFGQMSKIFGSNQPEVKVHGADNEERSEHRGEDSKQPDVEDHGAHIEEQGEHAGKEKDQNVEPHRSTFHKTFVHGRHDGDVHGDGHQVDAQHDHPHYPSTTSTVIALMLVGMMAMGMTIFYLVTHPHRSIQKVTWTILSSTISLFCAVLIFSALKAVIGMCLGEKVGIHSHHLKPDWAMTVFSLGEFIFTFVLCQILMVLHRNMHYRLVGWAKIGGHMTAFAAIEFFGNVYHYSFSSSWPSGCILVLLASSVMCGLSAITNYVRNTYFSPESKQQRDLFIEEGNDSGSEHVSLTIGLLISLLIRHMITGHLPPVHGSPRNKTQAEIWQLFACAIGLILMLVIFTFVAGVELQDKEQSQSLSGSSIQIAQYVVSMSAGWCLLSWGQWLFWSSVGEHMSESDKMQARMFMAIACSGLVFSFIFIFDVIGAKFASKMSAINSTMALLLGLAWEAVFVLSIESISGHYIEHPTQYIWCEVGLTVTVCVVVLPVWWWRILPKAEEAKEPG